MKKIIISEFQQRFIDVINRHKVEMKELTDFYEKDKVHGKRTMDKNSFLSAYFDLNRKHDAEIAALNGTNLIENKRKRQMYNHLLSESVFKQNNLLKEDYSQIESSAVKTMINSDDWQTPQNPRDFRESLMKSNHVEMLTPYSVSELSKMRLFKLDDYNIGFALKAKEVEVEKDGVKKIH